MNIIKPTGQDRVNYNLNKALFCIDKLKESKLNKPSSSNQKKMNSLQKRILNIKKRLVFLSTRARNKLTQFYASNALKEIAQELNSLKK